MRLTSSLAVLPPIHHVLHRIKLPSPRAPLDRDVGASIGLGCRPLQCPHHVHLRHEEQSMTLSWHGGGGVVRQQFPRGMTAWIGNHDFHITVETSGWWRRSGVMAVRPSAMIPWWSGGTPSRWRHDRSWSCHRRSVEVEAQQGSRWLRRHRRNHGDTMARVGLETLRGWGGGV
jgi:hypothetical protein